MRTRIDLDSQDSFTFEEGYNQFMKVRKVLNVSEATIKYYECGYRQFTEYFNPSTPCNEIDINTVYGYIEFLKERNSEIHTKSINTYLVGLRAIFNYLAEEELMPKIKIKLLKEEETIKPTYTDAELERLLRKPKIKDVIFSDYRNWVIVCYLMATGNRASTVCALKVGDFDFDSHEIALKKLKGKRQYIIPMSTTLEKTLKEYLVYRKPQSEDDAMFCNQFGEPLNYNSLATAIKRYNKSRGVYKTSLHLFRHTFAKKWILAGGDIFRLQKILGHKSIEMVRNYVNIYGGDLRNNFDTFNPLDNLKGHSDKNYITMKK